MPRYPSLLLLALAPVLAWATPPPPLPVLVPDSRWAPLRTFRNRPLETALEELLRASPLRSSLVDQGKLAVGLVDMQTPERPRFATVNGDTMLYAASLPKIGILWAAHMELESGRLKDSPELREKMTRMLRNSSNEAATAVYDQVGFEHIAEALQDPRYHLYEPDRSGGIWVGKRYAKGGVRHGDPLKNISHAATATQVCRFYYLLATGHGINPERSREMLGHLSKPGINHHLVAALRERAPQARLYRKSGTWSRWTSDSVLVWGPERRYILVGLCEAGLAGKRLLPELVDIAERALGRPQGPRLLEYPPR